MKNFAPPRCAEMAAAEQRLAQASRNFTRSEIELADARRALIELRARRGASISPTRS
jgi:hypothetical protein